MKLLPLLVYYSFQTLMQLSIVSLAPSYLGNSRDLAGTYLGIYRILYPRRPGTYPGLMQGDISLKRVWNLPWDVLSMPGLQVMNKLD